MKRILALLTALLLAAFTACRAPIAPPEPEATPAPTAVPTAVPTEAPTPVPTERPDFSGLIPQTGRLTDGPIFPEPFKYLVLQGDSNLHYVYNDMGELLYSFAAENDEDDPSACWGLFTEEGICCWHRLSDNSEVKPFKLFDGMAISVDWHYDETEEDPWESAYCYISLIRDEALENPIEFEEGELNIGTLGGLLRIDGGYLLINRGYDTYAHYFYGDEGGGDGQTVTRLDENFNAVGTLDTSKLGYVTGVLGRKYLLGLTVEFVTDDDGWQYSHLIYSVYSMSGRLLMENVEPVYSNYSCFYMDDELVEGGLKAIDYIKGPDGKYYDCELHRVDTVPDPKSPEEMVSEPHYYWGVIWLSDQFEYIVCGRYNSGVYQGIKDKDGNWIFRVYSPYLAEDSDNERYGIGNWWED